MKIFMNTQYNITACLDTKEMTYFKIGDVVSASSYIGRVTDINEEDFTLDCSYRYHSETITFPIDVTSVSNSEGGICEGYIKGQNIETFDLNELKDVDAIRIDLIRKIERGPILLTCKSKLVEKRGNHMKLYGCSIEATLKTNVEDIYREIPNCEKVQEEEVGKDKQILVGNDDKYIMYKRNDEFMHPCSCMNAYYHKIKENNKYYGVCSICKSKIAELAQDPEMWDGYHWIDMKEEK